MTTLSPLFVGIVEKQRILQAYPLMQELAASANQKISGPAQKALRSLAEWRIIEVAGLDVVVARLADDTYHAFNNACPHLHLPMFDRRTCLKEGDIGINTNTGLPRPLRSDFTEDRGLICRWHHSCFDLQTGEIRDWAPVLNEDGTTTGWEFLGDVSRHQTQLEIYPCRVSEGSVWLALS